MAFGRDTPRDFKGALQTVREILSTRRELIERGVIQTEAEQIVQASYQLAEGEELTRMQLHSRFADRIPERAAETAMIMALGRAEGKLLQHLTGFQTFLSHDYLVSPSVLIPRPETEVLASVAFDDLSARDSEPVLGLELGLGSGVLSVELLHRFPGLRMIASETSPTALATATRNASRILGPAGLARLLALVVEDPAHALEPFQRTLGAQRADFLISNPPYLARGTEVDTEVDLHEPHQALYAPSEDLAHFYRKIALGAESVLKPGGSVYLELPHERASMILALFQAWDSKLLPDLTGRSRVLVAHLAQPVSKE